MAFMLPALNGLKIVFQHVMLFITRLRICQRSNVQNIHRANPHARRVNYAWEGHIDNLLAHTSYTSAQQKKKLHFVTYENATWKDRLLYEINRHAVTFEAYDILRKIKRVLKKMNDRYM